MVGLDEQVEKIKTNNPNLPEEFGQSIVIGGDSFMQTLGYKYEEIIRSSLEETEFTVGGRTYNEIVPDMSDNTCSKRITVRLDHDDENVNYAAELVSSIISSVCDHPRVENNKIITNRGLATVEYEVKNGKIIETSSYGMGLQEGFEEYTLRTTMRNNYNDDYTTTRCIHQEVGCEWLMSYGLRDEIILSALTGNRDHLANALTSTGYDIDTFLRAFDLLREQNEQRSLPDSTITNDELTETLIMALNPLIMANIGKEKSNTK